MTPALAQTFPALANAVPQRALGRFPTPIERVRGLVPDTVELWVKREDLAGAIYGGNKVRKLEFLLARPGAGVVTAGGYGSHHVLATARYGQALGLPVEAVVFPQPATAHARGTLQATLLAGARLWPARGYHDLPLWALRALWHARRRGLTVIAPGGSSPLGTLGWVGGGREIAAQVQAGAAPRFDVVYVAVGSGGTAAGLLLGLGDAAQQLRGVRVVPWIAANRPSVELLTRRTRRLLLALGCGLAEPAPRFTIDGRWVGAGYGDPTAAATEAVAQAAQVGLSLETTYTGKTLAALLADARAGRLSGQRVLFMHTYGATPAPDRDGATALAGLPMYVRRWATPDRGDE